MSRHRIVDRDEGSGSLIRVNAPRRMVTGAEVFRLHQRPYWHVVVM